MQTRIGIMQGRLVPPEQGRFQSFPAQRWRDEFALAREAGLDCIEWIYEEPNEHANPLRTDEGAAEVRRLSAVSGVKVRSICADYYMTRRLITARGDADPDVLAHLRWLIGRARLLDIAYVVLPFVDASSLPTLAERAALPAAMAEVLATAASARVELHLETDFSPAELATVLRLINSPWVKANYDMGNSASLGFDAAEELTLLAPWLGSVHIKDRVRGGGTVPLGTGNTDFPVCFDKIQKAGFDRWLILQAARGPEGGEVAWAIANRYFSERYLVAVAG